MTGDWIAFSLAMIWFGFFVKMAWYEWRTPPEPTTFAVETLAIDFRDPKVRRAFSDALSEVVGRPVEFLDVEGRLELKGNR